MQEYQLLDTQEQEDNSDKIGACEVLQIVQKARHAQGNKEITLRLYASGGA